MEHRRRNDGAAMSRFGSEHRHAFLALVEPLARVGRHHLFIGMPAMRQNRRWTFSPTMQSGLNLTPRTLL